MAEDQLSCSTDIRSEADSRLSELNEENEIDDLNSYDSSDGGFFRCDRCDFETSSPSSLSDHLSTCQGDERRKYFECDVCLMKFSNGANMRRHKMRHTGVKPFECRVCQKRFFRKDHLAEHYTTHTKTLPFQCPVCNRGFQRQIAMRAHFQNEHVVQNEMNKTCPLCPFTTESMKFLRTHFFDRHGIDLDKPANSDGEGRQEDNATPPMHFLTPHVEISMAEPSLIQPFSPKHQVESEGSTGEVSEGSSSPPQPPTPHVSLIPIKQEAASSEDSSTLSSLIKVSPLKSLLSDEPRQVGHVDPLLSNLQHDTNWRHAKLTCRYCSIIFPDQTLYFLHKGCHSADSNPWKCNICGEQTSNVYDFNSHLLSKTHH